MSRSTDWSVRRAHHPGVACLADLVGDPDSFIADDFSRRVCCYPGIVDPTFLADPERLWGDVLTGGTRTPALRIVRQGDTLPRQRYTRSAGIGTETVDDLIQPNRVLELFDEEPASCCRVCSSRIRRSAAFPTTSPWTWTTQCR